VKGGGATRPKLGANEARPTYCPKCGSLLATGWDLTYLAPHAGVHICGPEGYAVGECLIARCRSCGYEFTQAVKG
jgi:RNase P subunit RPR2